MARNTKSPAAGGFLIAIGSTAGAIIGLFRGQPTEGFLIGLGAGVGMAIAIWLIDRRK